MNVKIIFITKLVITRSYFTVFLYFYENSSKIPNFDKQCKNNEQVTINFKWKEHNQTMDSGSGLIY